MSVAGGTVPPMNNYFVSIAEVARQLGVRPYDVWLVCESGELASVRIGRRRVVPAGVVGDYAARMVSSATVPPSPL